MRTGFNFSASPAGAFAIACTATPNSFAPRSRIGRPADEAGTQIAPVPRSWPSTFSAVFSQYTSQFAFNNRLISLNELLMRWLMRYPAGFEADPMIELGGGGRSPVTFVNGPSNPSRM